MPRFYFYLKESGHMVSDEEGLELASPDVARAEAMDAVREILAQSVRTGEDSDVESLIVTDADGHPIMSVSLKATLNNNCYDIEGCRGLIV
jgi:hypothetical protein